MKHIQYILYIVTGVDLDSHYHLIEYDKNVKFDNMIGSCFSDLQVVLMYRVARF